MISSWPAYLLPFPCFRSSGFCRGSDYLGNFLAEEPGLEVDTTLTHQQWPFQPGFLREEPHQFPQEPRSMTY